MNWVSKRRCAVLCVYVQDCLLQETRQVVAAIERAKPDYLELLPSNWVLAVFLRPALGENAASDLRAHFNEFPRAGIAVAQGDVIVARSLSGRISGRPIGPAFGHAMDGARSSARQG